MYSNQLPEIHIVDPVLENHRYHVFREFEKDFIDYFSSLPSSIDTNKRKTKIEKAFGRWIMLQISLGHTTIDPTIPSLFSESSFDQLKEDIINFTGNKDIDTDEIIRAYNFSTKCTTFVDKIKKHTARFTGKIAAIENSQTVQLSSQDLKTLDIPILIYKRTKLLYVQNTAFTSAVLSNDDRFHCLLYCLYLRYLTISEEGVRQGAMSQHFFDALYNEFHINFEGFAASFAASSNNICSLFPDVEKYFGSYGNFFSLIPKKGFYQVNPPLDSLITVLAMKRVLHILNKDTNKYKLGFIVFIPTWDYETAQKKGQTTKIDTYNDFPIYYELKDSPFLVLNYDVVGRKIAYVHYQKLPSGSDNDITLGNFDCPHIMVLGNNKFKMSFKKQKMLNLLDKYTLS